MTLAPSRGNKEKAMDMLSFSLLGLSGVFFLLYMLRRKARVVREFGNDEG